MDWRILIAAAMGAASSILVNRDVAVFNDGFRPMYAEYFAGGLDRKALAAAGFALSIGILLGYGVTTSIAVGILIFHSFLLAGDIIGSLTPKTPTGIVTAAAIGASWSAVVYIGLNQISLLLIALPVDVMTPLSLLADYIIATFPFFPALAAAYQFGTRKGAITGILIAVVFILMTKFGTFHFGDTAISLSAAGMAMLTGMVLLIIFAMMQPSEAIAGLDTSAFDENARRIRSNIPFFALNGGVLCTGAALILVTVGMTSGTLTNRGDLFGAALFTFAGALGYVPLVYTTAIASGVFTTGSRFVLAAGLFVAAAHLGIVETIAVSFVTGALLETFEASIISGVGNRMNRYPPLRVMGNHIRKSMTELLEISLLIGSVVCGGKLSAEIGMGGLGALFVLGAWMLNKHAEKKVLMQMIVGPIAVLTLAIIVNILSLIGLSAPVS